MLPRFCLVAALLTFGCGAPANDADFEPSAAGTGGALAGAGGAVAQATSGSASGGSGSDAGGASAGAPAAGSGGLAATSGSGGSENAMAGQPGASGGGSGSGGSGGASGGAAHGGAAQAGTSGQAGAGGQTADPLKPVPLAGCPGYVKVLVPKGTCVWFHGTFTRQTETCSLVDPTEGKCATSSAVSSDLTSIVSDTALIDRFDLNQATCPKQCN